MKNNHSQPLRILFAPHEIGGQMQLMAEELRRRGHFATAASYSQEWFGHVNDINLNLGELKGSLRKHLRILSFTLWAAQNYDVFHFFWGESLYGLGQFMHLDLPVLKRMKKKIFVHFRGIELIDLKYFDYLRSRTTEYSIETPALSRPDQLRSLALWRKHANKLLVSEPDLLRVASEAVLVQQAIDLTLWQPISLNNKSPRNEIIRIAHAPSMRRKKGTEFVERSVAQLIAEGFPVELVLIENIPFSQVKQLYETCDIGIDQMLYGWYGKVSIELMALGKPVVCFIDPEWHPYRPDMPIINANPNNLTLVLRALLEQPERWHDLGKAGQEYVSKYHDVKCIIDQCLEIYQGSD